MYLFSSRVAPHTFAVIALSRFYEKAQWIDSFLFPAI
jgi:hypothetical protein